MVTAHLDTHSDAGHAQSAPASSSVDRASPVVMAHKEDKREKEEEEYVLPQYSPMTNHKMRSVTSITLPVEEEAGGSHYTDIHHTHVSPLHDDGHGHGGGQVAGDHDVGMMDGGERAGVPRHSLVPSSAPTSSSSFLIPLTPEEELLLCGVALDSPMAMWLQSIRQQLDQRAVRRGGGSDREVSSDHPQALQISPALLDHNYSHAPLPTVAVEKPSKSSITSTEVAQASRWPPPPPHPQYEGNKHTRSTAYAATAISAAEEEEEEDEDAAITVEVEVMSSTDDTSQLHGGGGGAGGPARSAATWRQRHADSVRVDETKVYRDQLSLLKRNSSLNHSNQSDANQWAKKGEGEGGEENVVSTGHDAAPQNKLAADATDAEPSFEGSIDITDKAAVQRRLRCLKRSMQKEQETRVDPLGDMKSFVRVGSSHKARPNSHSAPRQQRRSTATVAVSAADTRAAIAAAIAAAAAANRPVSSSFASYSSSPPRQQHSSRPRDRRLGGGGVPLPPIAASAAAAGALAAAASSSGHYSSPRRRKKRKTATGIRPHTPDDPEYHYWVERTRVAVMSLGSLVLTRKKRRESDDHDSTLLPALPQKYQQQQQQHLPRDDRRGREDEDENVDVMMDHPPPPPPPPLPLLPPLPSTSRTSNTHHHHAASSSLSPSASSRAITGPPEGVVVSAPVPQPPPPPPQQQQRYPIAPDDDDDAAAAAALLLETSTMREEDEAFDLRGGTRGDNTLLPLTPLSHQQPHPLPA